MDISDRSGDEVGRLGWISFGMLVILASLMAGLLRLNFGEQYYRATLPMLMNGEAYTPFQYRLLMPMILKLANSFGVVDLATLIRCYETLMMGLGIVAITVYARATGLPYRIAFATGLAYFFLLPFFFVYQKLGHLYYPSDSASVVFSALALWAIVQKRTIFFLAVFCLGLLNRESIVLLLPLALWQQRANWKEEGFWWLACVGLALVFATRLFVVALYAGNQGAGSFTLGGYPNQYSWESSLLHSNLSMLTSFDGALLIASVLGFLWVPLVICYREIRHSFVAASLAVCVASLVVMFVVGNLNEPRIFCDLAPIILVATAHLMLSSPRQRQ